MHWKRRVQQQAAQCLSSLRTSTVSVLLLSAQTWCSGRDVTAQEMQLLSSFPLLGRPGEPAAVSPELFRKASASCAFFLWKYTVNWAVPAGQQHIDHCLTSCSLLPVAYGIK